MTKFSHNPFSAQLDVIATVKDRVIEATIADHMTDAQREDAALTEHLREAMMRGADINDLSNASGLTTGEIRRRIESRLIKTR